MKILKRYPEVQADWLLHGTYNSGTDPGQETKPAETVSAEGPGKDLLKNATSTLFDELEVSGTKPENKPQRLLKKEKTDRKIEKIVVFYDDWTFREYEPEK